MKLIVLKFYDDDDDDDDDDGDGFMESEVSITYSKEIAV
jgi:hypothetical protein